MTINLTHHECSVSRIFVSILGIATGASAQHINVDEMPKTAENVFQYVDGRRCGLTNDE